MNKHLTCISYSTTYIMPEHNYIIVVCICNKIIYDP